MYNLFHSYITTLDFSKFWFNDLVNKFTFLTLELPPKPNIITQENGINVAYIKWDKAATSSDEKFIIDCINCPSDLKKKFPLDTKSDNANITGLGAFAIYKLELIFENNITKLIDQKSVRPFQVKTKKGSKLV